MPVVLSALSTACRHADRRSCGHEPRGVVSRKPSDDQRHRLRDDRRARRDHRQRESRRPEPMERRGDRGGHVRGAVGRPRVLARAGRERHDRAAPDRRRARRTGAARGRDPASRSASRVRRRARRARAVSRAHRAVAGGGGWRRDAHDPGHSLRAPRRAEHGGNDRQRRSQSRAGPVDRDRQGPPGPLAKSSGPDGFISGCVREDDLTVGSFPPWFRRWGVGAWLVVGMALVVVAAVWLLSLTSSIVGALIAGAVIGAVGGVVVDALERRGWPRVAGAAVVTLTLAALTLLVVGLVLGAITSQSSHLDALLSQAVDKVQGWAQSLGITSAADAAQDIKKAAPDIGRTLLKGVASGISGL